MKDLIYSGILGFVVADALGVPVEFISREELARDPVTNMREYGTFNQPRGTWSDDSTMTLCTMESLIKGLDYDDMMSRFAAWYKEGYLTPHGVLFDIGISTSQAISSYIKGVPPLKCGLIGEFDNGNGSLMRILPLAYYTANKTLREKAEIIENVSALTHAHKRSVTACLIYTEFACELLKGRSKEVALRQAFNSIASFCDQNELKAYGRIKDGISAVKEQDIRSSGYVVDTLEAVFWCFFTTNSYRECVLKAVNLGDDTDTVAAIAGGLAGIYYGLEDIPSDWMDAIVKLDEIKEICERFSRLFIM